MNESLADLLHRSADKVPGPDLDFEHLVSRATRTVRRRRATVVAAAAVVTALVAAGSVGLLGGPTANGPSSAPSPNPTGTVVDPRPTGDRALVYASGKTVHVGDHTFTARSPAAVVAATDDGVIFVTEDGDRSGRSATLWFNDGSSSEIIGRVPNQHVGLRTVFVANPGSMVVWPDATNLTNQGPDRFVVYDTSRHAVVTRLPFSLKYNEFGGEYPQVLHVDERSVFFSPVSKTPGCWVGDDRRCRDPQLFRYDVASRSTEKIGLATFEAELNTHERMFVLGSGQGDTGTAFTALDGARFDQVGNRLVPVDSLARTSGEPVDLRAPAGFSNTVYQIAVVQWLNDDRVVLWSEDPTQGDGDLPAGPGTLLVCTLSDGGCRVASQSSSSIVPPGS